jgi:Uma2 family endonuclease
MTTAAVRFTSADLETFPDDGKRREIIDGELYVSKQPTWYHQTVCGRIFAALDDWSVATGAGGASVAPGLIFAEDDDVAPDVAWASTARLTADLAKGKLYAAAELVVEVLSPGKKNIQRDRETKLKLYARRGVSEYWIVDWPQRTLDTYRLIDDELQFIATLTEHDTLVSPLLPGFKAALARVFVGLPAQDTEEETA